MSLYNVPWLYREFTDDNMPTSKAQKVCLLPNLTKSTEYKWEGYFVTGAF